MNLDTRCYFAEWGVYMWEILVETGFEFFMSVWV